MLRISRESLLTLCLLALGILAASLLFGVESQVLEQEDLAFLAVGNSLLDFGADTVRKEGDGLGEKFFELGGLLLRWLMVS
jgi:hypothetical protein